MLAWNRLRIDPGEGSAVVDYRIQNGSVESRRVQIPDDVYSEVPRQWHRLSAEELSSLVMSNKVVAHWLTRRMGTFAVLRACSENIMGSDESRPENSAGMAA
ncbi:MAG TPA: hypothetical protein VJQ54_21655 [Candidatus Sulfotelmatobacter sp.]|nr:hypothetical protein [Candidatus Sulfotelmatobacter sp.]